MSGSIVRRSSPFPTRHRLRRAAVGIAFTAAAGASVAIAPPAGATTVTDEAGLRTAYGNPSETAISITSDIVLTCAGGGGLERSSATPLHITGNGHTITQTCLTDIAGQSSVGALTIDDLTLVAAADGGGISANLASLIVSHVTITGGSKRVGLSATSGALSLTDVTVTGFDIGVHGESSISLLRTTVRGPVSYGVESTAGSGSFDVRDSTIADSDWGLFSDSVALHVTNSTVSGNTGYGVITDRGHIDLQYATVFGNATSSESANVASFSSSMTSTGSVIAAAGGANPDCQLDGATVSNGYNFADDASCGFTDPTDHADAGDPMLGALADNGGSAPTHLPLPGSPLLDAIPTASCGLGAAITTDERGLARPSGAGCDIGAVEVQVVDPTTTTTTAAPSSTSTSTTTMTSTPAVAARAAAPVAAVPSFTG